MPELSDVETYRRYLAAHALNQRIAHVKVASPRQLDGTSPRGLGRALVRRRFESARRHGKHLFARIGNGQWLMLHFGMTGSLSYRRNGARLPPYTRLLIDFGRNRRLAYVDPRKLGRIALAGSPRRFVEAHRLGPDALALDMAGFGKLVAAKRGAIKSWLMDQHAIAASSAACSPSFKKCSGKPSRPGPILRGCRSRFSCPGAGAGALCPRCRGRVKACPQLAD